MGTASTLALVGALLLLGAVSNKLSSKANMPILIAFLAIGVAARHFGLVPADMIGGNVPSAVNMLGTVAMCFILYSGGLNTRFSAVRPVLFPAVMLASLGVVVTAVVMGLACYFIAHSLNEPLRLAWCLLLGALVSSTDAAAVMAVLRKSNTGLKGRLQPLLELESGSNDPSAYLLTMILLGIITSRGNYSFGEVLWQLVGGVVWGLSMGSLVGFAFGVIGQWIYTASSRYRVLEYEGLYFVIGIAVVLLTFGLTEKYLRANGLMAVYVCGITMGNIRFNFKKSLTRFNDGISWLMQVSLFTVLGFLISPGKLIEPGELLSGAVLSALLLFVARPMAVWLCLTGSGFSPRERVLVSWVGLRGAAPIMLATFPLAAGIAYAPELFNKVFFMVLASIIVQGGTLMPLARRLGLACRVDDRERAPLELEITDSGGDAEMFEFEVPSAAPFAGGTVAEFALPTGALILLVRRGGHFFPPRGNSRIEPGDGLLIMGPAKVMREVSSRFFPDSDYRPSRSMEDILHGIPASLHPAVSTAAKMFLRGKHR